MSLPHLGNLATMLLSNACIWKKMTVHKLCFIIKVKIYTLNTKMIPILIKIIVIIFSVLTKLLLHYVMTLTNINFMRKNSTVRFFKEYF